jgi:hypothetical protein
MVLVQRPLRSVGARVGTKPNTTCLVLRDVTVSVEVLWSIVL